jgi:putative inorganic carbon (HCO3(-)) transporter
MRAVLLFFCIAGGLGVTLRYPFAGVLVWTWFAVMSPHSEAGPLAAGLPLNVIIAAVTLLAWALSKERKTVPVDPTTVLLLVLLGWMTLATFFAANPSWSWIYWNRAWKIFLMCFAATAMATNKARFHALIWVVVLSLCYYGVKGGLFTIVSGGHFHVWGPPGTIIEDNNDLALALTTVLPMLNYLRLQSQLRFIRLGLMAGIALNVASILGSLSRGGIVALTALGFAFWLRAKNKLVYPLAAVIIIVPLLKFMPASFYDRMNTIEQYQTDSSFQGRVMAWKVAYLYATDHFPFGAGFYGPQLAQVWDRYAPGTVNHAAHSIYFQVLGEHGWPALFIYLAAIGFAFLNLRRVMRLTAKRADLAWASDLARMMQLSLFAFCVGGAALSMAYYDVFILWISLSAALRVLVKRTIAAEAGTRSAPSFATQMAGRGLVDSPAPLRQPP